jgi:hypothetical protein
MELANIGIADGIVSAIHKDIARNRLNCDSFPVPRTFPNHINDHSSILYLVTHFYPVAFSYPG